MEAKRPDQTAASGNPVDTDAIADAGAKATMKLTDTPARPAGAVSRHVPARSPAVGPVRSLLRVGRKKPFLELDANPDHLLAAQGFTPFRFPGGFLEPTLILILVSLAGRTLWQAAAATGTFSNAPGPIQGVFRL